MATPPPQEKAPAPYIGSEQATLVDEPTPGYLEVNETGHVQELERNFSLLSVCSVGIVTGNTWAALGGSIAVAI
jgi:choline transport protein